MTTLADIMTRDVFTTPPATSVAEVAASMVRGRFGSAMVMQGPMVLGILTERDVLRAAASGTDLRASPVSEWMTRDAQTASPDVDSEEAAQLMLTRGFRHLPVTEGGRVTGIVSLRDVLSARVRRPSG